MSEFVKKISFNNLI